MSRTEKIYARIDDLESEYLSSVRDEFVADSDGWWSPFLNGPTVRRRQPKSVDPARYDRLEKLETEIASLRRKLGETRPGSVLGIVKRFRSKWETLGVQQTMEDWNALVKNALREIEAIDECPRIEQSAESEFSD